MLSFTAINKFVSLYLSITGSELCKFTQTLLTGTLRGAIESVQI